MIRVSYNHLINLNPRGAPGNPKIKIGVCRLLRHTQMVAIQPLHSCRLDQVSLGANESAVLLRSNARDINVLSHPDPRALIIELALMTRSWEQQ
jgi:hypothetical protein